MHQLEKEIEDITESYKQGKISLEEKNYLLQEILDVKIAHECVGNESLVRNLVSACRIALAVVI